MSTPSQFPVSTVAYYGRAWSLQVTTQAGAVIEVSCNSFDPNALRIEFEVSFVAFHAIQNTFIKIYNMNNNLTQTLITQGSSVVLDAGYQAGNNYGNIFTGKVIRATFDKMNVTDSVVTLQCVTGFDELVNNMVNFATGPMQSQTQIIQAMAANAMKPFQVAYLDPSLSNNQLPKSKVLFGTPAKYIEAIARDNNMSWMINANGVSIGNFDLPDGATPDVTYSAAIPPGSAMTPDPSISYTILGSPQQDTLGVNLRVQLDTRLQVKLPPMAFKIDGTVIRQLPVSLPAFPPLLAQDGVYAVAGIRHIGDSVGNNWFTEIQGFLTSAAKLALLQQTGDGTANIRHPSLVP